MLSEVTENRDASRVKLVRLSRVALVDLLRQDGKRAYKITGLPDDAVLVGVSDEVRFEYDEVVLKVWSKSFPEVPDGRALETLSLCVHAFFWYDTMRDMVAAVDRRD